MWDWTGTSKRTAATCIPCSRSLPQRLVKRAKRSGEWTLSSDYISDWALQALPRGHPAKRGPHVPKKQAKKPKSHIIKTAAVVDFMGHGFGEVTPEEEIEVHKERFGEFAAPAKLKVHAPA